MNPPLTQDISLYELALNSSQAPNPLQVSPVTFKAAISTTIELLIDQQVSATLWAKLPKGRPWLSEIIRYRQFARSSHPIYLFSPYREEGGEADPKVSELEGGTEAETNGNSFELVSAWNLLHPDQDHEEPWIVYPQLEGSVQDAIAGNDLEASTPNLQTGTSIISIPLLLESHLKREYFLLVLSPRFCCLLLAHRPRSVRSVKSDTAAHSGQLGTELLMNDSEDVLGEEVGERKHPLLMLYSLSGQTIEQVLDGIRQVVTLSQARSLNSPGSGARESGRLPEDFSVDWDELVAQCSACAADPLLLSHLGAKAIQRQEEVWHRAIAYRKQAEEVQVLQVRNDELLNAIRRKDEFLNNVGQELRTPLTNMKTALSLLNSAQLKPAQRQRYMQLLSTECDRQSSLITGLLDLVQLEHAADHTSMQPIDLTEVVPGVVSTYQPLAQEKGVMLAYTIPENLPTVLCLNSWLKQIVINLLHNGIKFTPTGGQVWVRVKQQGDYVQMEFRDTGIGIAANEIPKIFDRFYRVRSAEELGGAGLGLTIVQQILLRCGGSISVKSKPGEGTTFNVLLPIYHASGSKP